MLEEGASMKIDNLRYFEEVCNTNSFSKVANVNFISQSSVSRKILEVEEFFDAQLIKREKFSKKIDITPKGKKVLDFCVDINEKVDLLKVSLSEEKIPKNIKIGISLFVKCKIIKSYLKMFLNISEKNKYNIEVEELVTSALREKIKNQAIDFAITYYLYDVATDPVINNIKIDEIGLSIFGKNEIIENLNEKNLKESLYDKTFISLRNGSIHHEVVNYILKKLNIKFKKIIYVDTPELLEVMVKEGVGLTILGESKYFNEDVKSIKLNSDIKLKVYFEYYKYRELALVDRKIIALVKNNIKNRERCGHFEDF